MKKIQDLFLSGLFHESITNPPLVVLVFPMHLLALVFPMHLLAALICLIHGEIVAANPGTRGATVVSVWVVGDKSFCDTLA